MPDEIRDAVYLFRGDVGSKQSRFWLLLVLSAGIVAAGIVADSTATVIGAMIIAPLATAYGELRRCCDPPGSHPGGPRGRGLHRPGGRVRHRPARNRGRGRLMVRRGA